MAANDFAVQNGTEKIATNAITTMNGTNIAADLIEVQLAKMVFGSDGVARHVDAANGLPVLQVGNGLVSTANSSTVALAANAVFTGTAVDISEYSTIMVTVFADQASATDGLRIEQSSNGTNWDFADIYSIPISTGKVFSVGVVAQFFRVVYTNGATANTAFRLQSLFSKAAKKNSSVRPQDGRTNDNDFEEVLSYPMVYIAATNTWERARGTQANGSTVDVTRSALPTGASTETTLAALNTKVTAVNTGAVVISGALPAGANSIGTVQPPAITKGTQGTVGVTTQALKDAGRARVSIIFMAVAPAVADTLLSLIKVTNGVAAAGATSIGVTAGKTLSISSITFSIKANAAAAAFATLTLRQNPAGATVLASVAETRVDVGNTAATIGAADKVEAIFPDGMEFSGTQTLGISLAAQAITNIISISINGFEY